MSDILPKGFLVRAPVMDDVKAVTELVNAWEIAEYGEAEMTEDEVRNGWKQPGSDLAQDGWLVVAPNGQIVARAGLGHREPARMYISLRVHPSYTSLGIERYLLRLAEERSQHFIPQAPAEARVTLNSWISGANREVASEMEQEGFKQIRAHWTMEIEFDQPPPPPEWPEGIAVRTFEPGQERVVFTAFDEAFQDHWGHMPENYEAWKHWTIEREDFDPALWFIAFDRNNIAGLSLCEYERDIPWVGDLAVRRPWRRKGLGMALLRHSFGEFYRRGSRKARLGVDSQNLTGATRLYERAGMHKIREALTYEKVLRPGKELSTQVLTM